MMGSLLCFLTLFYINAPMTYMRELPTHESKIVSQALFSEEVKVLDTDKDFVKIETVIDDYVGWVPKSVIYERSSSFYPRKEARIIRPAAHLYHMKDTIHGPFVTLPFESRLEVLEEDASGRWLKVALLNGRTGYVQRGDVALEHHLLALDEVQALAFQFLGLPYTWGGRSSFGYDCSGFVQMLYRQMGVYLPRDAKGQIHFEGFKEIALSELSPGDLIFFGLAQDKVLHVGFYLGNNEFIHTSPRENLPYLRVSRLSDPEWRGDQTSSLPFRAARTLKAKDL